MTTYRHGRKPPIRAVIVNPGAPGKGEPVARLEDGRTMPMGLNTGGEYAADTLGWAQYHSTPSYGLWKFTLDMPDHDVVPA